MKQIIQYFIGILATMLIWAPRAMAYNNWGADIKIFSLYDVFFDILSFSVAVVAFVLGIQMLHKFSGKLKSTWRYCLIIIALFIILQILSVVSMFYSFEFSGFFSIIKFFIAVFFLVVAISAKNFVQQILRKKIIDNKDLTQPE